MRATTDDPRFQLVDSGSNPSGQRCADQRGRAEPDHPGEARRVGDAIDVDWERFDLEQFHARMHVEYEHGVHDPQPDVTGDDPVITGKIAFAHVKEFPDYYQRPERMEEEPKREWAKRPPASRLR